MGFLLHHGPALDAQCLWDRGGGEGINSGKANRGKSSPFLKGALRDRPGQAGDRDRQVMGTLVEILLCA